MPDIKFLTGPDGRRIAYTQHGSGPALVCPPWWVSHVERDWQDPRFRTMFEALGAYRTVIRWDRGGSGLSDRERTRFDLESEVAIITAIVEHLQLDSFALFGISCGALPAIAYAAREPGRVTQLVLIGAYLKGLDAAPEDMLRAVMQLVRSHWGLGAKALADLFAPDLPPEQARRMVAEQLATATPEMAASLWELSFFGMDVRKLAPQVQAPALVLHRRGDQTVRLEAGRDVAAALPHATFTILEGNEHAPWLGAIEPLTRAIDGFLCGSAPRPAASQPDTFRRTGAVWQVIFAGQSAFVAHTKGMSDLAVLLGHPGADVLALELQQGVGQALEDAAAQPVLDDRALGQYRARVRELEQLIGDAERDADLGALERLRNEWEAVTSELGAATGLGGRQRHLADPAERARKAVTARIRQALGQIRDVHPALADHLEGSVSTGRSCGYRPAPPVMWLL
jgi:pimeloyl-ACP methyl ester carboxylesterase